MPYTEDDLKTRRDRLEAIAKRLAELRRRITDLHGETGGLADLAKEYRREENNLLGEREKVIKKIGEIRAELQK
jgi:cell division protein FtsB